METQARAEHADRGGRSRQDEAAPTGARILVIDDDERNLFALKELLADLGEIVAVSSGEAALKQLLDHDVALVLLDVRMPGLDGYETATLIRARPRLRRVPIVFLTAIDRDEAAVRRGYAMGAVDYVVKPIDPLILRSKVAVFVDLYNKAEENLRVRNEKLVAEQALRRIEAQQAAIIQSLPLALYTAAAGTQRDGTPARRRFIGDRIAALCGFAAGRFSRDPDLWAARIHPEDQDRVRQTCARLMDTEALTVEYRWHCADGQYRAFLDQAVLVRDAEGVPKEIVGSVMDVTERRRLEEQLVQAQKMETIGKLTGGIAHDFNNMLTVVIGSLDRLGRELAGNPRSLRRVELALEGALRCADLTQRLLTFARRRKLEPRPVNLNGVVTGVHDMVRRVMGDNIALAVHGDAELWLAQADPSQLESALVNLVVNARDAMPDGGTLTIATRNVAVRAADPLVARGISPGDYVEMRVADTGTGIPPEIRSRVFEPFFTTKEVGQGTGLGLSIVYGFVKESGGQVILDSEVGRGTTVCLYLPRAEADACEPADTGALETASDDLRRVLRARGEEVILAVEDDAAVRQVTVNTLKDLGYSVLEAENGPAALAALARTHRIDLLFTDLAMPGGLSGRDLAREAAGRRPGLKVLLTSAHVDRLYVRDVSDAKIHVLAKPYREPELARAVRVALDSA